MTAFAFILTVIQALALLWAAIQLSNALLRTRRIMPLVVGLAALVIAIAIGRYGAQDDPHRSLCSTGDCLIIILTVGWARLVLVNRESIRLNEQARLDAVAAAAVAADARKAEAEAYLRATAASLEARRVREAAGAPVARPRPSRLLT